MGRTQMSGEPAVEIARPSHLHHTVHYPPFTLGYKGRLCRMHLSTADKASCAESSRQICLLGCKPFDHVI